MFCTWINSSIYLQCLFIVYRSITCFIENLSQTKYVECKNMIKIIKIARFRWIILNV